MLRTQFLYPIFIAILVSACVHKGLNPSRTPAAGPLNELILSDLLTLPETVTINQTQVNISDRMNHLNENTLNVYAPDNWNVRRWLNHYYRTNPNLFAKIIGDEKLTEPAPIFEIIKSETQSILSDPKLVAAIANYTSSSDSINGALWKSKSFVFDRPNVDAKALGKELGVNEAAMESAMNLREAIKKLTPSQPLKPWVLFRGTEIRLAALYDLLQKRRAGQPVTYPHYGFGSYSVDFTVALRFTKANLVTKAEIANVLKILENPDPKVAQTEIQKMGYDWNRTSVASLLVRLTQKGMSILLDSWSKAPGELEAIQNPEIFRIDNVFSLANDCRNHLGEVVPGMNTLVDTWQGKMTIPEAIDQFGMLVLESNDLDSQWKLTIDINTMAALCALRATITPSN